MANLGSATAMLAHLSAAAHLVALGRGFILWLLFRALARAIGPVAAVAVIAAVVLVPLLVRRWQQR
jgi:hypothetical protein